MITKYRCLLLIPLRAVSTARLRFLSLLFLIFVVIPTISCGADHGVIKGIVMLGEERAVLAGVSVLIVRPAIRKATDADGRFRFDGLPSGTYELEVSFIGYKKTRVQGIIVSDGREAEVNVTLQVSPFLLNEVVVTGSLQTHLMKDTPVITEVVTGRDIAAIGSSDLADVMRAQTGIEIGTGIGQTQNVRLQGLKKNQVLVLLDGERMTGRVDDALDLSQIPVSLIERIEIVKGPLSSMYGSDALGGVVNVITKDPRNAPSLLASTTVGSYGRQDYQISGAHVFRDFFGGENGMRLLLSAGWNKFFGVDYNQRDNIQEMPEYDRKNIDLKSTLQLGGALTLELKAGYYRDRLEWLAGGDAVYRFTDLADNEKVSFSGVANYVISPSTILKATAYSSRNDHGSSEQNQFGYRLRDNRSRESIKTYRAQVSTIPYSSSLLTFGYEGNFESVRSGRIEGGGKEFANHVLFVEDEWTLSPFTLAIGGRYSDNSVYGGFFAPRVSVLYRPTERLTLRSSYGRGFRSPSILELFIDYDNSAAVGYLVQGNPSLQPETSHGFNLGFDYARDDLLWFRINAYYNDVDNLINYYLVSTSPNIYSYHNISRAVTRGVDVDIDIHPLSWLAVDLGYNYTSSKDDRGQEVPFVSPHSVNWRITYSSAENDLSLTLRGKWTDRRPVVDEQTNLNVQSGAQGAAYFYTSPYAIVDARISKKIFSFLEVSAGINNIANKTYYPFGQIKGREFYGGASLTLR